MMEKDKAIDITEEDIREAMMELKTYLDITEEDLKRIYILALEHAKKRLLKKKSVKDIMTKEVVCVREYAEIKEAARLLSENRISRMPVIDNEGKVIGVISEADILVSSGIKRESKISEILRYLSGEIVVSEKRGEKVGEIMTSPAITIKPEEDIRDAVRIMEKKGIKWLPVIDREGKIIGVISRADIVGAISSRS